MSLLDVTEAFDIMEPTEITLLNKSRVVVKGEILEDVSKETKYMGYVLPVGTETMKLYPTGSISIDDVQIYFIGNTLVKNNDDLIINGAKYTTRDNVPRTHGNYSYIIARKNAYRATA